MCGLIALLRVPNQPHDTLRTDVERARDSMRTRGPDGAGTWIDASSGVALGQRRLAILDLGETAAQPMRDPETGVVLVYNGELYDHEAHRRALEARGHVLRSTGDTEVLLRLYLEHGPSMVRRVRGMFAFAIWDPRRPGLLVGRDLYGIKPLYVARTRDGMAVASQVQALRTLPDLDPAPEPAGHVGYFLWGSVPEPFTLYRDIHAVPPGTTAWLDASSRLPIKAEHQRTLASSLRAPAPPPSDPASRAEALHAAIADTVQHHLVADVPVGCFLSAGLDSTTLASHVAARGGDLRTVTLGFRELAGTAADEVPLAEAHAKRLGATHSTVWVERDDFETSLDPLLASMDQPSLDGVNTWFVSWAAKRAGLRVALSGLGGDELFGGYPSFEQVPRMARWLRVPHALPGLGRALRGLTHPLVKRRGSPKLASLVELGGSVGGAYQLRRGLYMPWELPRLLDRDLVREGLSRLDTSARLASTVAGLRTDRQRVTALESTWYMRNQLLRDSDWAGMAHSVEIRVPLVDATLLETLSGWLASPRPPTKHELAMTARPPLPTALLDRPKSGFSVPVRDWLLAGRQAHTRERGLRGWSRLVYERFAST